MAVSPTRSVRIIAKATDLGAQGIHETVNIITTVAADVNHSVPQRVQLTGAQSVVQTHDTHIDAAGGGGGAGKNGLRTIFISGYTAPN